MFFLKTLILSRSVARTVPLFMTQLSLYNSILFKNSLFLMLLEHVHFQKTHPWLPYSWNSQLETSRGATRLHLCSSVVPGARVICMTCISTMIPNLFNCEGICGTRRKHVLACYALLSFALHTGSQLNQPHVASPCNNACRSMPALLGNTCLWHALCWCKDRPGQRASWVVYVQGVCSQRSQG